jgi:CRISPR-associated endonuclease Cas2
VIYDLPDSAGANKRRTRLHKLLSGYGKWTQYSVFECFLTKNFLMVQAPGFIRGINPKPKIENPQAPAFIRAVNLKSQI